ncbi:hypothetical protein, partial [Streptomyces sp. MB09-02B]|uniref:hypothetical protein n=1 Tax=Streptomyces sp. MB09-02B TaxID=3028667 RepID=UPI0029A10C17
MFRRSLQVPTGRPRLYQTVRLRRVVAGESEPVRGADGQHVVKEMPELVGEVALARFRGVGVRVRPRGMVVHAWASGAA